MFNEENKKRFMDDIDLDQYPYNYWQNMFNKSEQLEEMYGKDLYDFSKKEVLTFLKFQDSKSFDYISVIIFNLRKYSQWALKEGLLIDGQNHFAEISKEDVNSCVNKLGLDESIISKEEMVSVLYKIPNCRDKFVMIALFTGIKGLGYSEIVRANLSDIDESAHKMKLCTGRIIDISDDLIRVAKLADQEQEYIYSDGKKRTLYGDYGALYKNSSPKTTEEQAIKRFPRSFRNMLDDLGVSRYLTINSIFTSGLIDCINRICEKNNLTTSEVFADPKHVEYLRNQYRFNIAIANRFITKYKDYLK